MNTIKLALCFLVSIAFFSEQANAGDIYYGVLRGDKRINYKAVVSGEIKVNDLHEGDVKENVVLFDIDATGNALELKLLEKKKNNLMGKIVFLRNSVSASKRAFSDGLISMEQNKEREIRLRESLVQLDEYELQKNKLIKEKDAASPKVKELFAVRNIAVADGQYVGQGDPVMSIETLGRFNVDIKIDPSILKGNIKSKSIKYKSLVDGSSGLVVVKNVFSANDNSGANGMRMVTLELVLPKKNIYELLDTVFEIEVND